MCNREFLIENHVLMMSHWPQLQWKKFLLPNFYAKHVAFQKCSLLSHFNIYSDKSELKLRLEHTGNYLKIFKYNVDILICFLMLHLKLLKKSTSCKWSFKKKSMLFCFLFTNTILFKFCVTSGGLYWHMSNFW